jgi:hypothetical protein
VFAQIANLHARREFLVAQCDIERQIVSRGLQNVEERVKWLDLGYLLWRRLGPALSVGVSVTAGYLAFQTRKKLLGAGFVPKMMLALDLARRSLTFARKMHEFRRMTTR